MPKERKDKDKKGKSATKDDLPPAQATVLEVKPVSVIDTLASGYDTSSEGSAHDAQPSEPALSAVRVPPAAVISAEPNLSPQALEAVEVGSKSKKIKDKKEKSKSKDKHKDKDKKKASPPVSPASSSRASTQEKGSSSSTSPIILEPGASVYTKVDLASESYEETDQPDLANDQLFKAITDYFTKGNCRVENEKRAILMGLAKEGSGVRIAPGANVRLAEGCVLGDNTYVGLFSYVNGAVQIDEDVTLGPHCSITSNNHLFNPTSQSFKGTNENKPIHIRRGSWVAAGCTITAGATIGECVLVCAGAVVTKDVPDYSIVAGIPARVVGSVDPSTGEKTWFRETK